MTILYDGKVIIVRVEKVDISNLPNLQVIGCPMTGLEHLPWDEINQRGIKVISLQGETTFLKYITSTAEHAIGLMIALMRNYKTALNPPYQDREAYIGHRISGKTIGIIGIDGRVAKQVTKIAEGFGMNVIGCDLVMGYSLIDLYNLLEQSDVVSIHIPLPGNEGFFTKEMFKKMKPTSVLINTSRDAVIQKGALVDALKSGIIAGAAVDFLDSSDLLEYNLGNNNLILTNHIAGATWEDMEATEEYIIKQVNNYLER